MQKTAYGYWHAQRGSQYLAKTLLVMKLISVFFTVLICMSWTRGVSQTITFKGRDVPLKVIFSEVKKQTGYSFTYTEKVLAGIGPVSVNVKNAPLEEFLQLIFKGLPVKFSVEYKTVMLSRKQEVASETMIDQKVTGLNRGALQTIEGIVVDSAGAPLLGATITVRGATSAGISNQDGYFLVEVNEGDLIRISFIGFETKEIRITAALLGNKNLGKIQLQRSQVSEKEVVVTYSTGYQQMNKERATGSFVHINNEMLNRTISPNILDRIANITSSLRKDLAGGVGFGNESSYTIRGISTINANQKPLIVVDGFPYEEQGWAGSDIFLNNINPNDVESVTVLRDAAAASIWGARSANGVIVITTKKGRFNQQTSVSVNSSLRVKKKPDIYAKNIMSSSDVIEAEKTLFGLGYYNRLLARKNALSAGIEILAAKKNGSISSEDAEAKLAALSSNDVRDDIWKFMVRDAVTHMHHLNAMGGGNKMSYYGSIGFNKGISDIRGADNQSLTLEFKNTFRPVKNLEMNTAINYSIGVVRNPGMNPYSLIPDGKNDGASPYVKLADQQGNSLPIPYSLRTAYLDTVNVPGLLDWRYRPLDELKNSDKKMTNSMIRLSGNINYTIIPGISIGIGGQYNRQVSDGFDHQSLESYNTRDYINRFMYIDEAGVSQFPVPLGGIVDISNNLQTYYNLRGILNIDKTIGEHNISAIAGLERSQTDLSGYISRWYGYDAAIHLGNSRLDFEQLYVTRPNNSIGSIGTTSNPSASRLTRFMSYYGNMSYTFRRKYTISASAREEGGNIVGVKSNQRFKPMWSSGVMWDVFQEDFVKKAFLSSLKIRATYGFNGNMDNSLATLPTITYFISNNYYTQGQPFALLSPGNPGLTWERVGVINLGVDFGILKNRISGQIEYYQRKSTNLIGSKLADLSAGQDFYTGNVGGLKSKGFDLTLNIAWGQRKLTARTTVNVSYNAEKITSYYLNDFTKKQPYTYLSLSAVEGRPLSKIYSYKWGGLNPENGDPMGVLNGITSPFMDVLGYDASGNPATKVEDLVYHGRGTPPVFGNLLNIVTYDKLSVSFNCTYAFGYYFRRRTVDYNSILTKWSGHGDYSKRWQKPGDETHTTIPSFKLDGRQQFYNLSEVLVEPGDVIRLSDLNISYSFSKKQLARLPFQGVSISAYCRELGIIWRANNKGLDPAIETSGRLPEPFSIALNLNVTF